VAAAKKGGLGKGLGALIGPITEVEPSTPEPAQSEPLADGTVLISIDPRMVRPNPQQPRHYFDEESLEELAQSIRIDGLQEPVVVRERDGGYELVSGERRVRASVLAEINSIPAVCREVSDNDMLKLGLIENIQREEDELKIMRRHDTAAALNSLQPVLGATDVLALQDRVNEIHVDDSVARYIRAVIHATRENPAIRLGASPRGALALFEACQANALVNGCDFVTPGDVKAMAVPVLSHRILAKSQGGSRLSTARDRVLLVEEIFSDIPVPV